MRTEPPSATTFLVGPCRLLPHKLFGSNMPNQGERPAERFKARAHHPPQRGQYDTARQRPLRRSRRPAEGRAAYGSLTLRHEKEDRSASSVPLGGSRPSVLAAGERSRGFGRSGLKRHVVGDEEVRTRPAADEAERDPRALPPDGWCQRPTANAVAPPPASGSRGRGRSSTGSGRPRRGRRRSSTPWTQTRAAASMLWPCLGSARCGWCGRSRGPTRRR